MGDKTNKPNIYLIREEHSSFDQIIKPDLPEHIIDDVGTFYLEESKTNQPSWLKNFFLDELNDFKLFTAGAKGLLLVSIPYKGKQRIFAVVFGHGRHLLNDGVTEERFGLKVVLNSVDPKSLISIDKTTLGSISKQSREQMSREGEAAAFGIDIEQDLINAVTGRSNEECLGPSC